MTTSTADAIAAFLAKGGKVAKVDAGATCGMTNRDWHKAARDPIVSRVVADDIDAALSEREHELGAAFGTDGVNDFRSGVRKHGAKAMLGWGD